MRTLFITASLAFVSVFGLAHSSEKDKYFAKQCFKQISDNWLILEYKNTGTKVDDRYS